MEMKTRRRKMEEMLMEAPVTPSRLARALGVDTATVMEDLMHVWRRNRGHLTVRPAVCRRCGYVFSPSIRLPKRCPRCRGEWIEEPAFYLEK